MKDLEKTRIYVPHMLASGKAICPMGGQPVDFVWDLARQGIMLECPHCHRVVKTRVSK